MAIKQLKKYPVPCAHPDHTPDKSGLEPGEYEHVCDGCGEKTLFTIESFADMWKRINRNTEQPPYTPWIDPYPIYPQYPSPLRPPIDLTPKIWCSVTGVSNANV